VARHEVKPPTLGLAAFSKEGELLWEARSWENYDPYVSISAGEPLRANTHGGWICTIDLDTGKETRRVFAK